MATKRQSKVSQSFHFSVVFFIFIKFLSCCLFIVFVCDIRKIFIENNSLPLPRDVFLSFVLLVSKNAVKKFPRFFFTIMPLHDEGISEPSEKIFFSFSKEYYYIFFLSFRKFCYVFFFVIFCFFFKVCWRGNGIYIRDYY